MAVMLVADVSLLHGLFPVALSASALLALALSAVQTGIHWWLKRVLPIVVVSLFVVIVVNWALDLRRRFDEEIPFEFLLWAAMPLVAIGLVACGWRNHRRWRRAVSIVAVPLTLLYTANLINQFYGYEPTLGDVFGTALDNQVNANRLGLRSVTPKGSATGSSQHETRNGIALVAQAGAGGVSGGGAGTPNGRGGTLATPTTQAASHGTISQITIPGTESGFNARPAFAWVPPVFFNEPRPELPVVVMLAGVPGQPDDMIRAARADKVANVYAAAHGGVAPIIIFADENGTFTNDTECVDGPNGNAETYLTKDIPSFVSQSFGTLTGPTHWAIEGYSEGGTCAMDLALAHPDVYGTFVDIAGDQYPNLGTGSDARALAIANLYGGNAALFTAHDPKLLIQRPQDKSIAGRFEIGTEDHRRKADVAAMLDAAMRAEGLQSQYSQIPGGHDFPMAALAVADSFAWLSARVGV